MENLDIELFLNLPVDIRHAVYYHLDGSFTQLEPPSASDLYNNNLVELSNTNKKKTTRQNNLLDRLYPIYSAYIDIFEYNPDIVLEWLDFSVWLRYDAIVLDCLRLNHSFGGSLLGPIDWIYLNSELKLSLFNKDDLLQAWYTEQEYVDWIINLEPLDITDLERNYLRFNLDYYIPSNLSKALALFQKKKLFNEVYSVKFQIMEEKVDEIDSINTEKDTLVTSSNILSRLNDSIGSDSSINEDTYDTIDSIRSVKRRKTKGSDHTKKLDDVYVIEVLSVLKKMKNINKISVVGDILYDKLINSHGIRDRGNNAINYLIKRKIKEININKVTDLTKFGVSDLTKWDNLQNLSLTNLKHCDMNMIRLPKYCYSLSLKNVTSLKWYNILENSSIEEIFEEYTHVGLPSIETSTTQEIKYYKRTPGASTNYTEKLWKCLGQLNTVKIQNVSTIVDGRITIPYTLYSENRFILLNYPADTEIIYL